MSEQLTKQVTILATNDIEIDAISVCLSVLSDLNPEQCERVVAYIYNRFSTFVFKPVVEDQIDK